MVMWKGNIPRVAQSLQASTENNEMESLEMVMPNDFIQHLDGYT